MTFKNILQQVCKPYSKRLWLTSLCAASVSISGVALLGISGWFLTAAAVAGAGGPIVAQAFNYLLPSALIRLLAILRTLLRYLERYLGHDVAMRAMAKLRPSIFSRIVTGSPAAALALGRGDTSSRLIQDVSAIEQSIVMRSAYASSAGGLGTALLFCMLANGFAGLAFLGFALVAFVLMRIAMRASDMSQNEQAAMGNLKGRFSEVMTILPDIKSYGLQSPLLNELASLETGLSTLKLRNSGAEAKSQAALLVVSGICLVTISLICIHGTLAALALALLSTSAGFESLASLVRAFGQRKLSDAAERRVAEVWDAMLPSPARFLHPLKVRVETEPRIINPYIKLRLDGPSGSGKTRFIETVLGLRADQPVDSDFALCPQDAIVLTGTIKDNLLMAGKIDAQAMWEALDDACLSDRIKRLPNALETWVGDGGIKLSGGERKRLALARAYLRPAQILVLDEPTEGLDISTEQRVVERLKARLIRTGQGLLLISHREEPRRLVSDVLPIDMAHSICSITKSPCAISIAVSRNTATDLTENRLLSAI